MENQYGSTTSFFFFLPCKHIKYFIFWTAHRHSRNYAQHDYIAAQSAKTSTGSIFLGGLDHFFHWIWARKCCWTLRHCSKFQNHFNSVWGGPIILFHGSPLKRLFLSISIRFTQALVVASQSVKFWIRYRVVCPFALELLNLVHASRTLR